MLNIILTLKCGLEVKVIQTGTGTIRKLWYGFLFAFHSLRDMVTYRLKIKKFLYATCI